MGSSTGKRGHGFQNIRFYSVGYTGLNDISTGRNPGCSMVGFNAITGLRTPNFGKLKELALQLP
ncbi:hypothetical protein EDC04DRAFT_2588758 [Pisolithus marmoratus]|nr:hypothetical protein EDC04DRAFT_2588758 [Pisolithus marmoratus]